MMKLTDRAIPLPDLPVDWQLVQEGMDGYMARRRHLAVIVSAQREADGRRWWHISVSRKGGGLPGWSELLAVKDAFVGSDKTVLQVLPPTEKYVNFAPITGIEVMHLWHCLDAEVVPDFTHGTGSL